MACPPAAALATIPACSNPLPTADEIRLTRFSHGAGCACKLSPAELRTVLGLVRGLEPPADPNLLVGLDTADDAAVYRVRDDLAIVFTADFFTPIVDDPYDFGRVAATNALSDVYAMGGRPLMALNLVGWPREGLPFELLARVIDGGADVVRSAGALVVGGHSIDDPEPKYGCAVVGTVDPRAVLTNAGARPGDALVLTKPIGLGIISTALKRDEAPPGAHGGGRPAHDHPQRGRPGRRPRGRRQRRHRRHRLRVARPPPGDADGLGPLGPPRPHPGAGHRRRARPAGRRHGGRRHQAQPRLRRPRRRLGRPASDEQLLLADAQTSGGLLLAVEPGRAGALVAALGRRATPAAAVIGHTVEGAPGRISIR